MKFIGVNFLRIDFSEIRIINCFTQDLKLNKIASENLSVNISSNEIFEKNL